VTLKREPALIAGLIQAILALAVAFGFDLTSEQVGAILAVTGALLAVVVRQQVTPVADPRVPDV
jgi:hypothetical protein